MKRLSFASNGSKLIGNLHAPHDEGGRRPGIVVVGSWLTVKEQMPEAYVPHLTSAGYAALTFDFRGFGESEGTLREVESARSKADDILNAAAFLRTRAEVDPDRIGVLAICASASYTALALQGATRETSFIESVAMVAPWIHDEALVAELYGGSAAVANRLDKARAARSRYASTGKIDYVVAASNEDEHAAMYAPGDALDYYLNEKRGAIPAWGGRFASMAWTEWLQSDFVELGKGLAIPTSIVTGKDTATPDGVKRFIANMRTPPEVVWQDGTQFDFYDDPQTVRQASAHAIAHFRRTISR